MGQLVIGPVISALDGLVPGVGTMVGTGLNVFGMLTTGDPTGLLIQAGMAVYRMYQEQEKKRKENLTPDADRGKKLGYVRMGNKWVPAVFSTRAQDLGIGAHDDTVIARATISFSSTWGISTAAVASGSRGCRTKTAAPCRKKCYA